MYFYFKFIFMKHATTIWLCIFLAINYTTAQPTVSKKTIAVCLTQGEMDLYNLIMEYRKEKDLPVIPLSASLTFVAQTHCKDNIINKPNDNNCNLHSWSNKSKSWKACCYTNDHAQASCMWRKPSELTNYTGDGFEIAFTVSRSNDLTYTAKPEEALNGWKKSKGHNEVIINKGIWKKQEWKSIGIGIYRGFVCVWFGRETDIEPTPIVCK